MSNPFDDETAEFIVLVNDEGQYSLWPAHIDTPAGWALVGPRGPRQECLDFVEANWVDMRPKSLIADMERDAAERDGRRAPR